jgi:glycosyltransferase involved in cell wall biosynthesis
VSSLYPSQQAPQYCIFIEQQAHFLKEMGLEVSVLIPTPVNKKNKRSPIESFEQNGINCYRLNYYSSKLDKVLGLIHRKDKKRIIDFLDRKRFDIISTHLIDLPILKVLSKRKRDYKLSVHFHGLNVWENYYPIRPNIERFQSYILRGLVQHSDIIIGVSKRVKEIVEKKITTVPISVVYNGVNPQFFHSIDERISNDSTILCVGNLTKIKGQKYLIEAFAKFLNKNKLSRQVKLSIVGEGPEKENLIQLVKELKIEDKVVFHGNISYEDVAKMMQRSLAFVLPSYFEALGCVYLEAMLSGVVTVACDNSGIAEIIENNRTGFLVKPQDSDEIVNVLEKIFFEPDQTKLIAESGKEVVSKMYTWEDSAKKLKEIYNSL